MTEAENDLAVVAAVVKQLQGIGLAPVLVGGMALVILGSRRVTADFDFVITAPGPSLHALVDLFYASGFELASRVSPDGDVTATIDNARVAGIRLRLDQPASASFFHHDRRLRIDLLFDFPLPAAALANRTTRHKIASYVFEVASEEDLLELKRIARKHRTFAGDAQDIEFLEARRRRS
jgi:hypothetical protein